jgi:multiple sugar transport system permease protein
MKVALALKTISSSKTQAGRLNSLASYAFLSIVAIIMILPLAFLLNGSLQPSWQINADPVIWIPREWKSVRAGESERRLLLWRLEKDPGTRAQPEVIQLGSRRYTTVLDPTQVKALYSVPRSQLSEAAATTVNDIPVNVREWRSAQGARRVVALAKDPEQADNLIVMPVEGNEELFFESPLDLANRGKPGSVSVGEYKINVRSSPEGQPFLAIGPESELWVVGAPETAQHARVVQSSRLGDKELIAVGQTQLPIYTVEGEPEEARFVSIAQENWQPLMAQSLLAEKAFVARDENLAPERETRQFNGLNMTVRRYTSPQGGAAYDVVILTPGSTEYLVIATDYMGQLYTAPISELVEPGSVNIGTLTYRVQEDFEKSGAIVPSALVGDIQDLSVILPVEQVKSALDVNPKTLERSLRVKLNLTGYKKVLALKLAGTPFWRFFVNSGYVVLMNIIGHYFSCVLVAYGFARLKAPGKDVLFIVLLATMMVPYVIFVLPTYLIFRDIGLLGTMVPLWLRSFFGNAFLIFVLRQFFLTIPYDLDEAAILDGANRWQVLWQVIIPLSKPALAMVGIFTFWWYWNSFLDPLIYIGNQKNFTITLAMNTFNQQYARAAGYYDRILAGSVLTLMPMVLLFLFAQRYFIEGIQMQGLKR